MFYTRLIAVTARNMILRDMSSGMVLYMDMAHRCAWLATPDGSQRDPRNISIPQVRRLVKMGLITTKGNQNTTPTRFVISATGQAELRKTTHRETQSLVKPTVPMKKTKARCGSEAIGAQHAGRESLLQDVQAARKVGSLISE